MGYISEKGLVNLKNYQYKSGGYSWLDNIINPFWEGVVKLIPMWVAPNLLTFSGFVLTITSCIVSIAYDFTLTQNIPSWTFLFAAFGIFTYQTLDAIDGKQARRTKSSSPLGQLFDHGCDSFVMTFFLLQCAMATGIDSTLLFYLFLATQITLWGANQKEHHTGILHTHVWNIGVTEVEILVCVIQLVTFQLGQEFWCKKLDEFLPSLVINLGIKLLGHDLIHMAIYKFILIWFIPVAYIAGFYTFFSNIVLAKHKLRALLEWGNLFVIWALEFIWFQHPIYTQLAGPILIDFGIVMSLIVCKLIICSTTKDTPHLFHVEALPFEIITLIVYFCGNFLSQQQVAILFWINFVITLIVSLHFLRGVILQITNYLGIYCFSLQKRVKQD